MENNPYHLILKILHKGYQKFSRNPNSKNHYYIEQDPDRASEMIYQQLMSDKPCMIARFGAFELSTIINYIGVSNPNHSAWKYIKGEQPQWWWNKNLMGYMQSNAGFFPATEEKLSQFCEIMMENTKHLDILASWREEESLLNIYQNVKRISIHSFNPYWACLPWTRALRNKKILIIHPFEDTIKYQYNNNRLKIFSNQDVLPHFESLSIIRSPQTIYGETCGFPNWFKCLEWIKREIDKNDFEICLLGCGSYGFPLSAYIKQIGKKAIHMGGSLQLLFGIKGARWDKHPDYKDNIYNSYWIRPMDSDITKGLKKIENGCYL